MSNEIDELKYIDSDLALAYSRIGEVFGLNNLFEEAKKYHEKAIEHMPFVIDYKIKYGSFLFNTKLGFQSKTSKRNDLERENIEEKKDKNDISRIRSSLFKIFVNFSGL